MAAPPSAAAGSAPALDPATDWSGVESESLRAIRRAEFWPQMGATLLRAAFILWGVALAFVLVLELWIGWSELFAFSRGSHGLWGGSIVLAAAGAWLAFRISSDLGGELEDSSESGAT
jgi:hypothetical protein